MRSTIFLCMLLFLLTAKAIGQQQHVADSLRLIYSADTLQGVDKMELLRELAFNEIADPDLALEYAEELITLAKLESNDKYVYRGYLQKGNSQFTQDNLDVALEAYQSATEYARKADYKQGEGTSYMSMGFIYHKSGESDKAVEFFDKSLAIYREPEVLEKPNGLVGLGSAIYNIGDFYLANNELSKASEYTEEAGEIFRRADFRTGLNYVLGNKGRIYAKMGQYQKAEEYLIEAIARLEEDKDYQAVVEYQISLSKIYRENGDNQKAHDLAKESLEHARRLGMKDQISKSSLLLFKIDEELNNFQEAVTHLKLHMQYKDSMDVETVDVARFQLEKTERENAELYAEKLKSELELANQELTQKRQRGLLWAIGATALLLIFIAVGSYRRYRFIRNTNKIISDERDRSEGLLLNILPKQTALELKNLGRVKAQRFDEVSVLFTDFKGFTSHAESLDPEKLVKSIDYYFSHFDTIMDKYGLEKIKTVGDAYMCASGLPYPSEDHAIRIAEAALEILDFVEAAKKESSEDQVRFDVRIGINSGPVVAGVVGTKKFAYDIWGDTVNIASRMESAGDEGKINIAENTYELIKDHFECEPRGNIAVKNRGKLNMFYVLGKKHQSQSA